MFDDIVIGHNINRNPQNSAVWKTCLREITFFPENTASDQGEFFVGEAAYRFLLEVVCGLHSPIVGETEVMGQFKKFLTDIDLSMSPDPDKFKKFLNGVYVDAKRVRTEHLKGLGSRTYGSFVKKVIKDFFPIAIIGAGQLAFKITPWISKPDSYLHVFCRNPKKVQGLFEHAIVHQLSQSGFKKVKPEAVIVAAPLDHSSLNEFLVGQSFSIFLDLRETSSDFNPAFSASQHLRLSDLFSQIQESATENFLTIQKAKNLIEVLSKQRMAKAEYRPYGWEDLCG